ncbi:unnamed protein product [Lepeophtheirus salmonis]|uniref:(salmon louse) hypothetical protein n=1 Tax=Lepeophtheirus salmonis TaxID=72036 RepID=A0A7R8CG12_LEPSM|nr:unnamed protein product [Lepeophtheirus salmonis]CAF2755170.1 unnamed protein product [Lepeophtheirus salmonis]
MVESNGSQIQDETAKEKRKPIVEDKEKILQQSIIDQRTRSNRAYFLNNREPGEEDSDVQRSLETSPSLRDSAYILSENISKKNGESSANKMKHGLASASYFRTSISLIIFSEKKSTRDKTLSKHPKT